MQTNALHMIWLRWPGAILLHLVHCVCFPPSHTLLLCQRPQCTFRIGATGRTSVALHGPQQVTRTLTDKTPTCLRCAAASGLDDSIAMALWIGQLSGAYILPGYCRPPWVGVWGAAADADWLSGSSPQIGHVGHDSPMDGIVTEFEVPMPIHLRSEHFSCARRLRPS